MTTETEDDLFASIESTDVDPPGEPTPDEVIAKEFESGVAQSLGETIDKPEEVKALIAGMSEEELKAVLDKARRVDELEERITKLNDKAFGTIGQLKQTVDELRQRPQQAGTGKPVVSKDTFKKLAEYFDDEDVAEALANDLAGMQFEQGGNTGIDPSVIEDLRAQMEQKLEIRLLDMSHPDWRDHYQSAEFTEWKGTLKPEAQDVLDNSWDGAAMAKAFTNFKNWKAGKSEAEQEKKRRLEAGIQPHSAGRVSNAAVDDAFSQGLKKVVSQRLR